MSRNIIIVIIFFTFVSSCSNFQESLSMKKKGNVDEFLIEKKNPLVLPPDYSELQKPRTEIDNLDDEKKNID